MQDRSVKIQIKGLEAEAKRALAIGDTAKAKALRLQVMKLLRGK